MQMRQWCLSFYWKYSLIIHSCLTSQWFALPELIYRTNASKLCRALHHHLHRPTENARHIAYRKNFVDSHNVFHLNCNQFCLLWIRVRWRMSEANHRFHRNYIRVLIRYFDCASRSSLMNTWCAASPPPSASAFGHMVKTGLHEFIVHKMHSASQHY